MKYLFLICAIISFSACKKTTNSSTASAGTISTIAGNGANGYSGDLGPATSAELNMPTGVAVDASGNVYIADTYNNRIRKISAVNGAISTIAGNGYNAGMGSGGNTGDGGPADSAELFNPTGVAVDAAGNVYIADQGNNAIRMVNTYGIISTIAGGQGPGYFGDGGHAISAQLDQPYAVAIDASGNVYIADYQNMCIRKINTSGIITTIAGNDTAGFSGDGGPATAARLYDPFGVAVDGSGNIYIADYGNNCIRKVSSAGIITTIAGNGSTGGSGGFSGDGGAATAAQLSRPDGVVADNSGNIYIADGYNNRIRKINASGIISTVAGNGTAGYSGDGGPAIAAELYAPGLAVDKSGNIYIPDNANNRIRKVNN